MDSLSETWFVEGNIDFESKKYSLLAYLQKVNACFDEHRLYPGLSDLIFHYNNLQAFRDNKTFLQYQFPRRVTGIQLQRLELLYEEMMADDDLMTEIEDIVRYAMKKFKPTIEVGTDIYEFVEENLHIRPVGILPLDAEDGFFMISTGAEKKVWIYTYRLSIFEKRSSKYRALKSSLLDIREKTLLNTFEHIKSTLLQSHRHLPNPAVYGIETPLAYSLEETILPVAKRCLVKHITQNAA